MNNTLEKSFKASLLAEDRPALNSFRYLLMRIFRLVGCIFFEVCQLALIMWFAFELYISLSRTLAFLEPGYWEKSADVIAHPILFGHCYIMMGLTFAAAIFCWGTSMAFGIAHRWKWTVPGMDTVVCGSCHGEIQDVWRCTSCGAYRIMSKIATTLVSIANILLTFVWIAHDVTLGLLCFTLHKK